MEILIYNWKDLKNPDRGGAEIIVWELAKGLVKEGHEVTWFSREFKDCSPEEKIDGIKVIRQGKQFSTYFKGWLYYRSLREKPEVVIDMLNTLFWQTPLYARKSKRIAYVNQLAKEVLFFELGPVIARISYFLEKYQFLTYRKTPFICYANSTKEDLVEIGIPGKNIHLFNLGLDHKQYFPGGEKLEDPLFLCVNRLVKMKRTDLAVRAMEKVARDYPMAKLFIIGFGYEKASLEKIIKELSLENNVFFKTIPFLKDKDENYKTQLIQQAWALIFPSVKEGWGMTVTECAACGTPSIVTDVTGLRDSVLKDKTGLIISANPTPGELAAAMIKIIKDKELRENLSRNAIEWSNNFSWEKSFQEFYHQIKKIIQK